MRVEYHLFGHNKLHYNGLRCKLDRQELNTRGKLNAFIDTFSEQLIHRLDAAIDNRFCDSMSFAIFTIYRTCRLK